MSGMLCRGFQVFVFTAMIVSLAAFPISVHGQPKSLQQNGVVLLEKFTGTWCPPCGAIAPTIKKVWNEYTGSKLAIIEYHFNGAGSTDPFRIVESNTRSTYYGITSLPTVWIDGKKMLMGSDQITYDNLTGTINSRLATERAFEITISGNISSGSVKVHLDQLGSSSAGNLVLRYALVESECYYRGGTDLDEYYDHVVRFLPQDDAINTSSLPAEFTKTFTIKPGWRLNYLSFVVFLQNDDNKEVVQSCFYGWGVPVPEISPLALVPIAGLFIVSTALITGRRSGARYDNG
jgi:thiol-disulfide isomerase/thioredoxin